ncbi:MAG: 23S rRNA (pseudouridine(1915)-N(3))-methyltransferase RlmH, partial [Alphaproteobacteria bacterium]
RVGHALPQAYQGLCDDLCKRLRPAPIILTLPPSLHKGPAGLRDEGDRIRKALPPKGTIIALDRGGMMLGTQDFAAALSRWPQPTFIIGGAEGHDPDVLKTAHHVLSLGPMTMAHALAYLVLVEQLYRAQCIRTHHPYHRD